MLNLVKTPCKGPPPGAGVLAGEDEESLRGRYQRVVQRLQQ
ncbi:Hypothetical protein A7982_02806 [Minicystis rosea]|nr:Hypothetical protein A7982_02806 [Minicystis rosea]